MTKKLIKIVNLFLLVVYLAYFAGCNFFVHQHFLDGHKVVHSHPFASGTHHHSGNTIDVIALLQDYTSLEAVVSAVPSCAEINLWLDPAVAVQPYVSAMHEGLSQLRSPPQQA